MPKNYALDVTPANMQRRPQHAKDDAWIAAFLERAPIAHIATRWDMQPFINHSTFWYDEAQHEIYFHSNVMGRVRANSEHYPEVCVEVSEFGKLLPSNVALEFSIQYASVICFGHIRVIDDDAARQRALSGLIQKYFPTLR